MLRRGPALIVIKHRMINGSNVKNRLVIELPLNAIVLRSEHQSELELDLEAAESRPKLYHSLFSHFFVLVEKQLVNPGNL